MTMYDIEFTYKIEEYGVVNLEADNPDQADEYAREYVYEAFPDVSNVTIDSIKEVK